MHNSHIAIIGGGCAGLSAAALLVEQGYPVTLFEAAPHLGGRARTVRIEIDGTCYDLDNGQHILLGAYQDTLALLKKAGVNEQQAFYRMPLQIHMQAQDGSQCFSLKSIAKLPAPFHLGAGLMLSKGLNFSERFNAIRLMHQLHQIQFRIADDLALMQFLLDHGQTKRLIRYLWEPLCLAALNTPIEKASTRIFLKVLKDSFTGKKSDSDLLLPKQDLSKLLCDPLSHYITSRGGVIKLNHQVNEITLNHHGYCVKTQHNVDNFSHVIVATSPQNTGKLLGKIPDNSNTLDAINNFDYQPIYTVYLKYPAGSVLPTVMSGLSGTTSQWVFNKALLSHQKNLVSVIISAEGAHQKMTQQALAAKVIEELEHAFPRLGKPLWHKVIAEKRATFTCHPNLRRPSQQPFHPNLYLAGDFTYSDYPATIEGAIRSGLNCAQLIINE